MDPVSLDPEPQTICAYLYTADGCVDSLCQEVAFYPTMTVPNFFTPNGDMVNDRLDILSDNADELHQRIYNRWGQLVYESFRPDESWDGTFNGASVAEGVYFLEIEVSNAYSQEREIIVRQAVHVMR